MAAWMSPGRARDAPPSISVDHSPETQGASPSWSHGYKCTDHKCTEWSRDAPPSVDHSPETQGAAPSESERKSERDKRLRALGDRRVGLPASVSRPRAGATTRNKRCRAVAGACGAPGAAPGGRRTRSRTGKLRGTIDHAEPWLTMLATRYRMAYGLSKGPSSADKDTVSPPSSCAGRYRGGTG